MYNIDGPSNSRIVVRTEISDYVQKLKTSNGKFSQGVKFDRRVISIMANSVIKTHLFKLFNPLNREDIYNTVAEIANSISVKDINIDSVSIDTIIIMLENEIDKTLKYVYKINEYVDYQKTLKKIRTDLEYLIE